MILLSHRLHENFCRRDFSNQCLYNKAYVLVFAVTVQVGKSPDTVRRTANFLRLSGCMGFTRPSIPRFSRQNFCTPRICVFQAWNTDFAGICRFSASPSCMVHQHPLDLLQPVVYIRKNVAMKALQRNNEPNAIHIQEAPEASGEAIMAKPNSMFYCRLLGGGSFDEFAQPGSLREVIQHMQAKLAGANQRTRGPRLPARPIRHATAHRRPHGGHAGHRLV